MKSSFFEFHVATTALHTARSALSTTNHNIANAATKGYSRQYVELRASKPLSSYGGRGLVGTGSEAYGVAQVRDIYLDTRYWSENGVLGEYDTKRVQLDAIEKLFNGLSDSGLNATFNRFFNSIQELSQNSGDGTYRVNMVRAADAITTQINQIASSLQSQQSDINADIRAMVQLINGIGQQIRGLNEQIVKFEMDGSRANDLRDARANLIDELSGYINVEVREVEKNADYAAGMYPSADDRSKSQKEYIVLVNGYTFINNIDINPLMVEKRDEKINPSDEPELYDIYFANTHQKFNIYHPNLKGELKGLIDARDGNNGNYFTTTKSSAVTLVNTAGSVSLTITEPTRADLNGSGYITVKDPVTGLSSEHKYSSFAYDPATDSVTFTFDQPLSAFSENTIASGNAEITSGKTDNYKGIPYYLDRLSLLARTFAKAFNEGTDMNGDPIDGVTGHVKGHDSYGNQGNLFFSFSGIEDTDKDDISGSIINYNLLNCFNFAVDAGIADDPGKIAASFFENSDESENEMLFGYLKLSTSRALFSEGKISDYLIGMAGELGIDLKQAVNFSLNYIDVTASIDVQRKAISSVDLNEEMTNSVRYNQLFTAAAKLVNIIDGIYDTTINRLGNF